MSRGVPVPQHPDAGTHWSEAIYDPAVLDEQKEGTVCIDDVGTLRQRRYSNSHMGGGWTSHGCDPLSSRMLVEDGKRPVYLLIVERRLDTDGAVVEETADAEPDATVGSSIHDVAANIISRFPEGISTMKMHKLTFLALGWSHVMLGRPLFEEQYLTGATGPFSPDLRKGHGHDYTVREWPAGDANKLAVNENVIIAAVVNKYGALTGTQLAELVSKLSPGWRQYAHAAITAEQIRDTFASALHVAAAEHPAARARA